MQAGASKSITDMIREIGAVMPGGFFFYQADDSESVIYANDIVLDIFGCDTMDEFIVLTGGTFSGMVHPDDLEAVRTSIANQIAAHSKRLDYVEYRIIRKDGQVRWVDDYGRLVHTQAFGDVYYVLIRDITDEHIAEKERFHMEIELEKTKRASEIKSSFLYNVNHDIRTPMNAIKGFTELALRHLGDSQKVKDCLEKVREANNQLLLLIDDLLEMSLLDYGKVINHEAPCSLRQELSAVIDTMRARAEEKHLSIKEDISLPENMVYVDAHSFRRIMENILDNAVKFTADGGSILVSARQEKVSASGYARYRFEVTDNGIGMSEEFMRRMFGAFEREESSTKSGYTGAGLGLSITKKLLDIIGGSISVQSTKGKGSSFVVWLPLKSAESTAAQIPVTSIAAHDVKAAGSYRILLVEDIEINRELAEQILLEAGFLVESVEDGSDAVLALKNHAEGYYDLILMDIQMPVMNGYEATRAIRAIGREDCATIPIIALSANARDEDKRMSMENGMNFHIAKPFDIMQLINTVNAHIESRGSQGARQE